MSQLATAARELARSLTEASFTADGVAAHLGPFATEALFRGEPGVVAHACADESTLSGMIRFFLLRMPLTGEQLAQLLTSRLALFLIDAGVVAHLPSGEIQVALDIRPHVIAGENRLIFSDLDASVTDLVPGPDHVLGVGSASLSLLSATPCSPVESVLDLGTGSGVQAVAQASCAVHVVATDVHPRAIELADATLAGNNLSNIELRQGSWFEPVLGQRFDRIVANPPFVVGLPEVNHVYRDSGLWLDDASKLVVSSVADHLNPNGTAHILASWIHTVDQHWQHRVASWLPPTGVSAWILQRDEVDPGLYVSTWLKDESVDPRSRAGINKTTRWLEHFDNEGVHGVGFGWVFVRDIGDAPSEITAEELTHPFSDPLGPEVEEYFHRMDWLRTKGHSDVLSTRYLVRPGLALEDVQVPDTNSGMGFNHQVTRVTRTDGPRFSHEIDATLRSVLAGLHPRGLNLGDVVDLWAASHAVENVEELAQSAAEAAIDLIRHGLIIPAEIAELIWV